MEVRVGKAIVVSAIAVGCCISFSAHADNYTDVDVQKAYEQGYQNALKKISREQAKARAAEDVATAKSPAPAETPASETDLVDIKEVYSDAGHQETVRTIPLSDGAAAQLASQAATVAAAASAPAANPGTTLKPADIEALQEAIHKFDAWVDQAYRDDDDGTASSTASSPARPSQQGGTVLASNQPLQAPPQSRGPVSALTNFYPPAQPIAMPPPPVVSQNQPAPAGGRPMVWSKEYSQWVYLAN